MSPAHRGLARLAGLFLVLAAAVALPFLLWGDAVERWLSPAWLAAWLERQRGVAWAVAIGLLAADLVLPIPGTAVMAATGAVYGPLLGGLVSTAGACLAGLLGYGLCRRFGRKAALRLIGPEGLAEGERLFARAGGWIVAGSRWLPILPEVTACMAGLVRMPFRRFILALVAGAAPLGFAFAAAGHLGADRPVATLLLSALLPVPLWLVLRRACLARPAPPAGGRCGAGAA